ncbi:MAG: hypothetical protein H6Q19_491 [Bacteroidetes bacterium]|nr:hypothetical protein [Bacteroidota bacterium]
MKKNIIVVLAAFVSTFTFAQTEYDAFKLTQTDLSGSARYMGMGGAFGALGGDATAIKDNPAGLGVYRSSEIAGTLNTMIQSTSSVWSGMTSKEDMLKVNLNSFSYVLAMSSWSEKNSGLMSSNFSFTFNRLRNFNRKVSAASPGSDNSFTDFLAAFSDGYADTDLQENDVNKDPYNNPNNAWLSVLGYQNFLINPQEGKTWSSILSEGEKVVPSTYLFETGSVSEYGFGWGGNFNNNLFIGANVNMQDLSYNLHSSISENFAQGGGFDLTSAMSQTGVGFNLKLGAIYLPTNNLRLGVSFHTPTFYSISENTNVQYFKTSEIKDAYLPLQGYSHDYKITGPLQAQASAAYLFGKKGLISVEYDYVNYPGMRLGLENGDTQYYKDENQNMPNVYKTGQTLKVGAEYKLSPSFALRAGYALMKSANQTDYAQGKSLKLNSANTNTEYFNQMDTRYLTFGAGYRATGWFIDFAYAQKMLDEDMYPYQILRYQSNRLTNIVTPAAVNTKNNNIVVTLGIKL